MRTTTPMCAVLAALAACTSVSDPNKVVVRAGATLRTATGATVGSATITENAGGFVTVSAEVTNLAPGPHGIHLHSLGVCDGTTPSAFTSAGSHVNPAIRQHGLSNPAGPHDGDLPNLMVGADSRGSLAVTTSRVKLSAGSASLLDADGSAIVIHANEDDQMTDPFGNSGARMVCGVISAQ